jgi:hypothetical protein
MREVIKDAAHEMPARPSDSQSGVPSRPLYGAYDAADPSKVVRGTLGLLSVRLPS